MKIVIIYQHCNAWKGSSEERIVCESPLEAQKLIHEKKKYERYYAGNDFYYKRSNIFALSESVFPELPKQRPHARSKKEWEIIQEAAREEIKDFVYPFDEDDSEFLI